MTDESTYEWAESDWQSLGCCIALTEGVSAGEALGRLVTRPATELANPGLVQAWADRQEPPNYGTSVEATTVEGWAVIFESNGYQATLAEPLARLTEGTRGGVVYWSVNADMSFIWSVEGAIVRHFDPLLFENHNWVGQPLREEAEITFGLPNPRASALTLLERLTGVHLTRQFLDDRDGWLAVGHYPRPN